MSRADPEPKRLQPQTGTGFGLSATLIALLFTAALITACTSNEGSTQVALERAQATAKAAIMERNDAISERDNGIGMPRKGRNYL